MATSVLNAMSAMHEFPHIPFMLTPSFISSIAPEIATYELQGVHDFAQHIHTCSQEQFTGRLDLEISSIPAAQWSLFFRLGRLIWGTSLVHPIRRWLRQLTQYCSFYGASRIAPNGSQWPTKLWNYDTLAELVRQRQIPQEQMADVVEGTLVELLFDLFQCWKQYPNREITLTYRQIPREAVASTLVLIRADRVWQQAARAWEAWEQAGLGQWSANLAPVIWDADELRRQTSFLAYHNLTMLVDGNRSLRDLAVKLKQDPLPLTQSIVPYIRRGSLGLVEVGDLSYSSQSVSPPASNPAVASNPSRFSSGEQPLIAYIDDSRFDNLAMNRILAQIGYRFVEIRDPVQALPILLEQKPDLIFLDLLMPVTNGYEVCAQIRRISAFKETPIIIVTASDGIVDRVRAKLVGSSGFISKPIDTDKVLTVLQHYLPDSQSVSSPPSTTPAWFPT